MCFEAIQAMGNAARAVICGIVCCLCIGPILIIVGITLLASPNTRKEDVDAFNKAVDFYNGRDATVLSATQAYVKGFEQMTRTFDRITVEGDTTDVDAASHYVFTRPGVTRNTNSDGYTVRFTDENNVTKSTATWNLPWSAEVQLTLRCNKTFCTDDCSQSSYTCDSDRLRNHCGNVLRGSYTDYDGSCYNGDDCGVCRYTGTLSKACVVFALGDNNQAVSSTKYTSCFYPFTQHEYLPGSSFFELTAMSENDPFLVLQDKTDGSNDFGITAEQQKNAGVILLVLGIIITVLMIALLCFFIYRHRKEQETKNHPNGFTYPPIVQPANQHQYNSNYNNNYANGQPVPPQAIPVNQPYAYGATKDEGHYGQQQQQQPNTNYNYAYNGHAVTGAPLPPPQSYQQADVQPLGQETGGAYKGPTRV